MLAKEFFERVQKASQELTLLADRRAHYLEIATSTGTGNSEVHSPNVSSRVENAAVSMADLLAKIDEKMPLYVALVQQAETLIDKIPQYNFRRILTYKYLLCMNWGQITEKMQYKDSKSAYRTLKYALNEAGKLL